VGQLATLATAITLDRSKKDKPVHRTIVIAESIFNEP
jgi:hypothetical protein